MSEINNKTCPACGAMCAHDAVGCTCGHVFAERAVHAPPVDAYPRPGSFQASLSTAPSVADRIIPTKNPKALIAYYCGVFSIVPCFSPVLGPIALILGILGLRDCKRNSNLPGKGHAITGIVLGGITTALTLLGVGLFVLGLVNATAHG